MKYIENENSEHPYDESNVGRDLKKYENKSDRAVYSVQDRIKTKR